MIKKCINPSCSKEYRICDEGFGYNNCKVCGSILEIIIEEKFKFSNYDGTMVLDENYMLEKINSKKNIESINENKDSYIKNSIDEEDKEDKYFNQLDFLENTLIINENLSDIFEIDNFGYIYFNSINEKKLDIPKVILYLGKITYSVIPLKYDEITIGREARDIHPDIDLSKIDLDKVVSRRHAVIYKRNGEYYIKNISVQNSLRVNGEEIIKNKDKKLNNQDLIVLGNKFILKYIY